MPLRTAWMTAGLIVMVLGGPVGLSLPAHAQIPLTLEETRREAQRLESDFWEQVWIEHVEAEASDDGSIGWNYDDRQQLNLFSKRYRQAVKETDGIWRNRPVQDYVTRHLLAVQPNRMMPGRPGTFSVQILRTEVPNALAFSDGTIYVSTGLLATLDRSVELEALLAHQVAHILLDHAFTNHQSGEHWDQARNLLGRIASGVTSVMTPFGGGDAPSKSEYGLETSVSNQYLNPKFLGPAGLEYDTDQEAAANRLAREWLQTHDRTAAALHAALRKVRRASLVDRPAPGATFADLHPSPDRLRSLLVTESVEAENPSSDADRSYDRQMAPLLEQEAELEIVARRYQSAGDVLDRAIASGRASPSAYLLKAHALRNGRTDAAGHEQILALLDTAEARSGPSEPRIDAERALVRLRQDRVEQARRLLESCIEKIDALRRDSTNTPVQTGRATGDAISPEEAALYESLRTWATDMLSRLSEGSTTEAPGDG